MLMLTGLFLLGWCIYARDWPFVAIMVVALLLVGYLEWTMRGE